jgi:hypothetical protein
MPDWPADAAGTETPLVPATVTHTPPPPTITLPGVFPTAIVSVTWLVRGSTRETVPLLPFATRTAPAP